MCAIVGFLITLLGIIKIIFRVLDLKMGFFYLFGLGHGIIQLALIINILIGAGVFSHLTAKSWFNGFLANDLKIEDLPWSEKLTDIDLHELQSDKEKDLRHALGYLIEQFKLIIKLLP